MLIDAVLLGLGGVVIGFVGSLVVTRMNVASNERLAAQARRQERDDRIRELGAQAYVSAVEAVQWLSTMNVEDSVEPQFEDTYLPKTETAVQNLRDARKAITLVMTLGSAETLVKTATDMAVALNILDDAWHGAQEYRRKLIELSNPSTKLKTFYSRQFDREYDRLQHSRKLLTGFDGSNALHKEIDQGSVKPNSLLYELRQATSEIG